MTSTKMTALFGKWGVVFTEFLNGNKLRIICFRISDVFLWSKQNKSTVRFKCVNVCMCVSFKQLSCES